MLLSGNRRTGRRATSPTTNPDAFYRHCDANVSSARSGSSYPNDRGG